MQKQTQIQLQKERILIPNIFQTEALKKLEETKEKKGIVVLPTGLGKTYMATLWFKKKLKKQPNAKLLFVCHNGDILSQANEKEFQNCLKELDITYGYFNAHEKNVEQCTFATTQTLYRNLNKFKPKDFDYIIVDEAHHYQAKTFKKVANYFKPKFLLGLTATPHRKDGKKIMEVCGNIIYESKTKDAINKNLLSKIVYYCVDNDIDFSDIEWNGYKYDEKDLNRKICIEEYDNAILKEYSEVAKRKYNKQKTICFCPTVRHAHRMKEVFEENNIKSSVLTGTNKDRTVSTSKTLRKKTIEEFKNGDSEIIFVRDLFNEGIDIPNADCVMMLRPTFSHTIFTQQIGRGLRKADGKNNLLVLDFTGNARRCDINFEVLIDMIDVDVKKEVISGSDTHSRELIIIKNGNVVRLSKTKLNLFTGKITKENLIDSFLELEKELGKQPKASDIRARGRYSLFQYNRKFGSWKLFIKSLGRKCHQSRILNFTDEEMIKAYYDVRKKFGRRPRAKDFVLPYPPPRHYVNRWGSWTAFLDSIGETYIPDKISKEQITQQFLEYKKTHGRFPTYREMDENKSLCSHATITKHFGSYFKFMKTFRRRKYRDYDARKITLDLTTKDYMHMKEKLGRVPLLSELNNELPYVFDSRLKAWGYGGYQGFLGMMGDSDRNKNINIISKYKPKTVVIPLQKRKPKRGGKIEGWNQTGFKKCDDNSEKARMRSKIIGNIRDGDRVLLLESPELSAIKEIDKQNKKPKEIIIPNHLEFKELAKVLQIHDTKLKITLVNTSVLQYLADSEEKLDFLWLDYCGPFTNYARDLDVLFQKNMGNIRLVLTYNLFDPAKEDDSYYFTKVIDYVLKQVSGKCSVELMSDISYRYKKQMYNVGFNLQELEVKKK